MRSVILGYTAESTNLARTKIQYVELLNAYRCFFMTRCPAFQMQRWIDQAKNKLMDIIDQTKKDDPNITVRVAFVG